MEDVGKRGLGHVVLDAVRLDHRRLTISCNVLYDPAEDSTLADLAVLGRGMSQVFRHYRPVSSPLNDLSLIFPSEESDDPAIEAQLQYDQVYSRYLQEYPKRRNSANNLGSSTRDLVFAWYERRLDEISDIVQKSRLSHRSGGAACSIAGCLSLPQLLLVTTYTFLRSCLPFQTGDHGQILDILRREEKDWWPRIGSEGLSELISRNHEARDTRMDRIWEEIRSTLIQGHCCFSVSSQDLRDQLRYILSNLDQISANGSSTRQEQWLSPPKTPFGRRGTVVLVCFSLSVVPSGSMPPVHWEPDNSTLKDMLRHLNQSPLFSNGITLNELCTALSSLDLLFSYEDKRVTNFQEERELSKLIRLSYKGPHVPTIGYP
ncbi:hypothetical protein Aspvir_003341 [Aspergillus viridinutans]|uniref:Uncharacterized protein n=1 Tax=Aspergillus viridinutans TaxID=75553 RepID=A0A9P3FAX7_ASPVI|nr:uncharacterized protein Aspvir_003341 [Aspergillus viridinutans]GIK07675.1 hypothetical protein Aspvir_003341 [Aspergillus viridinutans]